ncbi:MAG: hypothetical protein H7837_05080 [Magnetococcus sp. MYC-9]
MDSQPLSFLLSSTRSGGDGSGTPVGEALFPPIAKKLTPEEEWQMNLRAVRRFSQAGNWPEVLKLLQVLSTKHQNNDSYKALGQRVWVSLKSDAPAIEVVYALVSLLHTLGFKHEIAGHVAALAQLVAEVRTPEHADRELAQGQAQQLMSLVCTAQGVEGRQAFDDWVAVHHLEDPDRFIPVIMQGLETMVGETWWIDRSALQREMEQANARRQSGMPHPSTA